jgi:hypothetical protein
MPEKQPETFTPKLVEAGVTRIDDEADHDRVDRDKAGQDAVQPKRERRPPVPDRGPGQAPGSDPGQADKE